LVAEDEPLIRAHIVRMLAEICPAFAVMGEASSQEELVAVVTE
jgi:DNA-binding NarL/FixJ family response regulator